MSSTHRGIDRQGALRPPMNKRPRFDAPGLSNAEIVASGQANTVSLPTAGSPEDPMPRSTSDDAAPSSPADFKSAPEAPDPEAAKCTLCGQTEEQHKVLHHEFAGPGSALTSKSAEQEPVPEQNGPRVLRMGVVAPAIDLGLRGALVGAGVITQDDIDRADTAAYGNPLLPRDPQVSSSTTAGDDAPAG